MILVTLANGFEEIEALTPVDLLRRHNQDVKTVAIGQNPVVGSHGIPVVADLGVEEVDLATVDHLILPGGMPGTLGLDASSFVDRAIRAVEEKGGHIGAICAAPSILGHCGYLNGRKATCFPGFEDELKGATLLEQSVVTDDIFTTASGAGVAVDFALELAARLSSVEKAEKIRGAMQCP